MSKYKAMADGYPNSLAIQKRVCGNSDDDLLSEKDNSSIAGESMRFYDDDNSVHDGPPEPVEDLDAGECYPDSDAVLECVKSADGPVEVGGYMAYSKGRTTVLKTGHAVSILMAAVNDSSIGVIENVPQYIQQNAIFLLKRSALGKPDDVLCDSNGQWELAYGGTKCLSRFMYDKEIDSWNFTRNDKEGLVFRRRSSKNLSEATFHRVIIDCPSVDLIFLQYYYTDGVEKAFKVRPHGNRKSDKPYHRMFPSARDKVITNLGKGLPPREIQHSIISDLGGVVNLSAAAQLPSMKAIYDANTQSKPTKDEDFNRLTLECIEHEGKPTAFIREVLTAPSFIVMLATDQQLDDLVRFATVSAGGGFSVDTTFNVGPYLVTVITVRYNLIVSEVTRVHPVTLGPVFLHKRRTKETYRRMAAMLITARPALADVKVIGTDADEALYDGFQQIFIKAEHILCLFHFTDNMVSKLSEFGMSKHQKLVMDAILGAKLGTERLAGYVDCETPEQYAAADESLRTKFSNMHENGQQLADYFIRFKGPAIQKHYSVEAQKEAGIHGRHYTQNPAESMNALIKLGKSKPRSAPAFAFDLEAIARSQAEQFELAVIGQGKYELVPEYIHLKVPFKTWINKSVEQRRAILQRIHLEKFDPERKAVETITVDEEVSSFYRRLQSDEHGRKLLAVSSISHEILCGFLDKAKVVLSGRYAVSHAVNTEESAYYVAGSTPGSMFKVTFSEDTGAIKCESGCRYYTAFGVCTEAVVLAIYLENMDIYVNWLNSSSGTSASRFGLHKLVESTGPPNADSKQHGTSRRKGTTARTAPVTEVLTTTSQISISSDNLDASRMRNKRSVSHVAAGSASDISTYDAAIHRHKLWERVVTVPEAPNPSPGPGEYEFWFLSDCPAQTKKCSGCNQDFRKKSKNASSALPPQQPNDLVAVSPGTRKWKRLDQLHESRSNVYIHAYRPCLLLAINRVETSPLESATFSITIKAKSSSAYGALCSNSNRRLRFTILVSMFRWIIIFRFTKVLLKE